MGKYFTKATCVYLDQFAVSKICDDYDEKYEPWTTIGNLLKEGVQKGKIVCPYSVEHAIETSVKHEHNALNQDINFVKLTRNLKIRNEVDSTARHIMAMVRNKRPDFNTYFQRFSGIVMDDKWKRTKFQEQRNTLQAMTQDMFQTVNVLRGASTLRPGAEMRKVVFDLVKRGYENDLLERFFHLSTFCLFNSREVTLAGITIPYWADVLFHRLVTQYRMTQDEARRGKRIVIEQGLAAFPAIFIRANLEASMTCNSKKETVNDQIDILRLAGALPAVDILLTDGGKANDLRDARLDKHFCVDVFSSKQSDLKNFQNRIESLL
ncbi:hypothetical protein GCM10023189_32880 [Nibrella saemangeumensis]|uniref:Uncharacterized protein n=1 Tax=Nibrella saemangeumensis TaxID=1084526 RepID=A0ABP8N0Q2_9BACT